MGEDGRAISPESPMTGFNSTLHDKIAVPKGSVGGEGEGVFRMMFRA